MGTRAFQVTVQTLELGTEGDKMTIVKDKIREVSGPKSRLLWPVQFYCHLFCFPNLCLFYSFSPHIFCLKTSRLLIQHIFLPVDSFCIGKTCYLDHFQVNHLLLLSYLGYGYRLLEDWISPFLVGGGCGGGGLWIENLIPWLTRPAIRRKYIMSGSTFHNFVQYTCSGSNITFQMDLVSWSFLEPVPSLQTTDYWKIAPIVSSWIYLWPQNSAFVLIYPIFYFFFSFRKRKWHGRMDGQLKAQGRKPFLGCRNVAELLTALCLISTSK